MSRTPKTKPECLVIEPSGRGFSLLAKKHDADVLAGRCLQSMLSFTRENQVFPGVDGLNFFYLAEQERAQRVLGTYLAEKRSAGASE